MSKKPAKNILPEDRSAEEETARENPKRRKLNVPRRYRLSFVNESTLNNVWTIGMSRRKMRIYLGVIIALLILLGSFIISFTPLRTLLPGYLRKGERREYIEASARLDSIVEQSAVIEAYVGNINKILNGEVDVETPEDAPKLLTLSNEDSIVGPTSAEAVYVEQYLARENFNIDARMAAADSPLMTPPVEGAIVATGATPASTVITIPRLQRVAVKSVEPGVVIDAVKGNDGKYTVMAQHPDGFVSRYGNLTECFVKAGQELNANTRIGVTDGSKDRRLDFSLWQSGTRIDPSRIIAF